MPTSVLMPQMGESIAEGTLVRWLKQIGESVDRDEPLFEISTDKVDAEIPSPTSGVLVAINVHAGEMAAVNSVVATIAQPGEAVGAAVASQPTAAAAPEASGRTGANAVQVAAAKGQQRTRVSPLVRRMARERGIDVSRMTGSGLDGRVTKRDLLRHLQSGAPAPAVGRAPLSPVPGDRVEPMSVMRKKIAEHMIMSRRTSAHVHSIFHVNLSTISRIREAKKAEFEKAGSKLTYMPFIAKAAIDAIKRHPVLNASIDADTIAYHKDVHLGIAVALETGLIVPVVKHADEKNMLGLARAIADVATRARNKKLSPEEVTGGTFTITNPGQYGAQFGLPIINQPQVAILCVGAVEKRVVVVDDALAIRPMVYLSLGFDHRLIDGAVADEFMADMKHQLEHFDPQLV